MSKQIVSQRIEQKCDGCGKIKEWECVGAQESTINEMQEWYTLVVGRKAVINGQFAKIQEEADACCLACVPAAVAVASVKVSMPPPSEGPDNIDLQALRNLAN